MLCDHIKKVKETNKINFNSLFYLNQCIPNIIIWWGKQQKIVDDICIIFYSKSLKSSLYFVSAAHCNLCLPRSKCSAASCGRGSRTGQQSSRRLIAINYELAQTMSELVKNLSATTGHCSGCTLTYRHSSHHWSLREWVKNV